MSESVRPPQFTAEARRARFDQRGLVLDGPLDDDNGTVIATQLLALAADDDTSDIALWIHSPGGSAVEVEVQADDLRHTRDTVLGLIAADAGQIQLYINCEGGDPAAMLAIYDTMQHVRPDVATTAVGQAIGVGVVMLAAGTPGKRAVLPHARVVLHQPAGQGRGAIPDLILRADELVRVRGDVEAILARHTGLDPAQLRADTDRDRVFTATDAVAYGLADRVLVR